MNRTTLRALAVIAVCLLMSQPLSASAAEPAEWLLRLNQLRSAAALPVVTEDAAMSDGCQLHARYMAMNGVIGHDESSALPYYSAAGNAAAGQSNVALGAGGLEAIDLWAAGPFHALGIIDPRLVTVGFGSYSDPGGWAAAALNVLGGRAGSAPAGTCYPVLWPGKGAPLGLSAYRGGESPDPLTGTGYSAPSGAPIIAQFGSGAGTPVVTASSLKANGAEVAHRVYTEATYTNPNASHQSLGRSVLGTRDAVVMMPREPLAEGVRYDVSLTVNGSVYAWSFGDMSGVRPLPLVGAPRVARYMKRASSHTVTGILEPAHTSGSAAVVIDAQRYESGRWVSRKSFTGRAFGTAEGAHGFRATVTFPYQGTWRVRTRHVEDAGGGHAVSAWRKVIVRS